MKNKFLNTASCLLLAMAMAVGAACEDRTSESTGDSTSSSSASVPDSSSSAPEKDEAQYTIDETIQQLSKSVYADESMTDDETYGLSDISNVGVIEEKMDDELYPIEKTGLEVIEYATYSNANTDYQKLLDAFERAKQLNEEGKKTLIELPENGRLVINSSLSTAATYTYNLNGYDGLYVNGNGCEIVLTYDNFAYRGFIGLTDCKDVHFNDITIDYEIPTAINGTITEIDTTNYTVTVAVDKRFNETVERAVANNASLLSYVEFDMITLAPKQGGNFCTASETFLTGYTVSGNKDTGYSVKVQFGSAYYGSFSDVALGDYANLAFSMYVYNGFSYTGCENVYMENVTIATCPGMGVVGSRTTNVYINRLQIAIPEDSGRLMTTTADGLHFGECYGDVKITNSLIEYCHDDALNIKSGYYYGLTSVDVRNKTVVISRKTSGISMPDVGNVIEFYDADTFEKKGYGTVKEVSGTESAYTIVVEESLSKQDAGNWGNNVVATNISKTAKFTFRNNIVRNKRNRGLLVQVRDAEISNNAFFNVGHGSVSIHSSLDVFNEATMPQNITVSNNKFVNNNYLLSLTGDVSVFARSSALGPVGTITGITIHNNFIARNGNAGISLQACSDSTVSDNLFYNNGRVTTGEVYECALEMNNAGNIKVLGNYAYNTLGSETYAGIITNGLTSPETITLDSNINLSYQVIEAEVSTTEVSKLAAAISIDGDLSDWSQQGTSVTMVGHSLATGKSIDPAEYANEFGVRTCKIGWTDEGIYIAFDIKDNAYLFKTVNNFWNGDCFEMFLSTVLDMPNADLQLYKNQGDVAQIACVPTWANGWTFAEARTNETLMANSSKIKASCVQTGDGYRGELLLPFEVFADIKASVDNGNEIAMAFVFADGEREDIGRKRVQVSNVPHFVEAWKTKTAKMPLFKFVG